MGVTQLCSVCTTQVKALSRTPAEVHGSCYSKCESPGGAKHSENTASHSTATLYQHSTALRCTCTTYIHQNPYMSQMNYQLTENQQKTTCTPPTTQT